MSTGDQGPCARTPGWFINRSGVSGAGAQHTASLLHPSPLLSQADDSPILPASHPRSWEVWRRLPRGVPNLKAQRRSQGQVKRALGRRTSIGPTASSPSPSPAQGSPRPHLRQPGPEREAVRCSGANGRRRQRGRQEAGRVPPALPGRLTAGIGGCRLAGRREQAEPRRADGAWSAGTAPGGCGAPPQAVEQGDSFDGGSGLWLRTWRPTRPAPSATASSAPASSRGSDSDAHAHRRPLRCPPVSRTAQSSQQPPAAAC